MTEMDEKLTRQILGDTIQPDGSLFNRLQYTDWRPGDTTIVLDSADFTAEQLVAIAWWMSNKPTPGEAARITSNIQDVPQ